MSDWTLKIPEAMFDKYHISKGHLDNPRACYQNFLSKTDYICNKIVEGVASWDDYADEKTYRQAAREEINKEDSQ